MIILLVNLTSTCDIDSIDFDNFSAIEFYTTCDWFNMKDFYYSEKNKDTPDVEKVQLIELALANMAIARKNFIQTAIKVNFGKNCKWITKLSGSQIEYFDVVKEYLRGETMFLTCGDYLYILNSFGSTTLTSDFDYSVYRINLTKVMTTVSKGLKTIQNTTIQLFNTNVYISTNYCGGRSADTCLDSNGYPEIFLPYVNFFKNYLMADIYQKDDARYRNLLSSKIIRQCVISQVYLAKLLNLGVVKFDLDELLSSCYETFTSGISMFQAEFNLPEKFPIDEIVAEPMYEKMITDEDKKNLILNLDSHKPTYVSHLKSMIYYFANHFKFEECIKNIHNPSFFLQKLNGENNEIRVILHKRVYYTVYDQLFYCPEALKQNQVNLVNQILLPFLGGCHIWASEAYITFGALEFVKYEKDILAKTLVVSCDTLFDSFTENMGMMLHHLAEYAIDSDFGDKLVSDFQIISDTFSKYLRRSLLALDLPCENILKANLQKFYLPSVGLVDLQKHRIYKFYLDIKLIDQSAKNKKDLYYATFKVSFLEASLTELIVETTQFFLDLLSVLYSTYDKRGVFLKSPIEYI